MAAKIAGKWAFVTGASRGVGQQICLGLAKLGVNLVIHSSDVKNQEKTKTLLSEYNIKVESVEADLNDEKSIARCIEQAECLSGGIDILYNNAALMTPESALFDTPMSDYKASFQVNVFSVIQICSYFAPLMKQRGYGRIINVSSGIKDTPILDAYSITKAALDKYTRDLAVELQESGVLANMLDPGWCRTDLGGPNAFNAVESVLPGAMIPATLAKEGPEAPMGMLFAAQDFVGIEV